MARNQGNSNWISLYNLGLQEVRKYQPTANRMKLPSESKLIARRPQEGRTVGIDGKPQEKKVIKYIKNCISKKKENDIKNQRKSMRGRKKQNLDSYSQ